MSLSFSESLANSTENTTATMAVEEINMDDVSAEMPTVRAYSLRSVAAISDSDGWTAITDKDKDYRFYNNEYNDDNYSSVDEQKNIILDPSQFNITQERNSQYIPFKMPRYYDGFDLKDTKLSIYYVNKNKDSHNDVPVDVYYNEEYIKFAWLVSEFATQVAGILQFEIHAEGFNSKNEPYTWKSRPIDKLNVLQSLEDIAVGEIGLSEEEIENWYNKIQLESQKAQSAAANAQASANEAARLVNELQDGITQEVETAVNNTVGTVVDTKVSEKLANYYTKVETYDKDTIDSKIESVKPDGYATIEYVDGQIGDIGESENVVNYLSNKLGNLVDDDNNSLTVEAYVNKKVEEVDVSEQIGDLGTDDEGNPITNVVDYVDKKVGDVDVSEQLANYYTKEETYTKTEVDTAVSNVKVDLSGYATTEALNAVQQNTVTNATNIATAQNDIVAIKSSLNSLEGDNKNLIVQYDEVGSILHLYEKDENGDITITDGDEQIKVKEIYSTIITGAGGGGSSLVSTVKLNLSADGEDSSTILFGNATSLNYKLSTRKAKESQDEEGNDITIYEEAVIPGDITLTLYRDNVYLTHFTVTKTSSEVQSDSVDISDYIALGNHVFTITASYVEKLGSDGETITVRSSEDWAINAVKLELANLPDSTWEATPKYGSVDFPYTPIGDLEKTVYFKIDTEEPVAVDAPLNGIATTYPIPQQTHGVHTLQVWCEGNVGGTIIPTEPHKYVLMFVENGNNTPIIRIKAPTTLEQYSSDNIYYNVLDPLNPIIDSVVIYDEDGAILSSVENVTSAERKYEFRPSVVKDKTLTIKYKEITESVTITVTKFPYEINAVTGDLMVDFVPTGRTNSDSDYDVFKNKAYTVEGEEIPITWDFSENFDWINGGWKTDENNDTYFCVKAGTFVDINYNLFGSDGVVAKKDAFGEYTIAGTGKEFKLIFKTANVAQANATWLQCVDVADKKSLGIRMEAQNAYIDSGLGTLEIPYVDNDIIEFDMNIVPITKFNEDKTPNLNVKAIPMIMTYEDGTPVQPKVISSASTSFKQDTPQPITIGSDYCDVHIYRMKIYERYLEDKEIITNFIADARSGAEMAKRYVRNDIYPVDNKQKITPESIAAACPDLKVYVLSAPYFTNDKGNKITGTTITQIHNTGTKEKPEYAPSENWTATGATHNGQGTSSNEYGYAGRNLEFNLEKATITLNDNTTVVTEIQLSPDSYPTNYLNFKINIASSENANNALLQKRYDRYLPYTSVASLIDDRKKNSMEFFNCVVFIQETDKNLANHREFDDNDVHFYGIGNIGDSKKTDYTRVNDVNDVNEFCVEIKDWNRYLSSFPTDTKVSTLYTDDDGVQVLRFEDLLVDTNLEKKIIYERDNQGRYFPSEDATIDKTKTYYIDVLENDKFDDTYTYEFRYVQKEYKEKDGADYKERNEEFQKPLRQKWIDFYRFITRDLTTNGDEDAEKVKAWKSELSDWFILDSALYYYLYTLRYTMVDNRAKNSFWHWGKYYLTLEEALDMGIAVYDEDNNLITDPSNSSDRYYDVNGNEIKNINAAARTINEGYRMEFWAYDNDTALGIDNAGKLEIPIGVEEDDVDAAGVPYFRAHDSLVFARIAKYFVNELEEMWHKTENPEMTLPEGVGQKVFDSISFIDEFDKWQNEFPEELWRLDYERKYKRTYVGGTGTDWDNALPQSNKSDIASTRFLAEMMNGRKKYQRRCFERNQEIYMSSKFKGEVNLGDTITLRGTGKPTGKVVPFSSTLNIVPFSKMYVNLYSATDKIYYHKKHEAGEKINPIPYPETTLDFIYIRGASQMQSLGNLSPMYLQTAELTSGAKLKTITLGNATDGYSNDSLKILQIGAGNKLLEELDIRNLSNLDDTVLPVKNIPSLKRVYAQGSNISEAVFANNGLLEEAYLPETIARLELRNLHYLKEIELESYDNLLHLVVVDCSTHKDSNVKISDLVLDMINQASDLQTLRVNNIDWTLDNTSLLERLYSLIKTPNAPEVVLAGTVSVPTIGQHDLYKYKEVWSGLTITPTDGVIPQFKVAFKNHDGTELDVQYVEQYKSAVDPITRADKPIATPTKKSTIQYSYTYSGWDKVLTNIVMDIDIYATYTESLRDYTIKYVLPSSMGGIILKTASGKYGDNIVYDGEVPTYTKAEPTVFYLFNRWDKSGFLTGDFDANGVKTVTAQFNDFRGNQTYFEDKELAQLTPVEIYAMNKLGIADTVVTDKDPYTIVVGNDVDYDDVESKLLISKKTYFNGVDTYIDTGIKLFDEDKDFVLAIDYEFLTGCASGATLAQCYQGNTEQGFNLIYNGSNAQLVWGASTDNIVNINKREMIVLRHTKGDNNLTIYKSNLDGDSVLTTELTKKQSTVTDATLIFGASSPEEDNYENHAVGNINWAKIWYKDLGDEVCRDLAMWTHESIGLEACGFKRFYLVDDSGNVTSQRCSFSLLATHLLGRAKQWNASNTNVGGWAASALNRSLNTRLYNAMPTQIKSLLKKMAVRSSVGGGTTTTPSEEISTSGCYITVPALIELDSAYGNTSSYNVAYGNEINAVTGTNKTISYLTDNNSRKRAFDGGDHFDYWTRSPHVDYNSYVWRIGDGKNNDTLGGAYGITQANNSLGVLIEISF